MGRRRVTARYPVECAGCRERRSLSDEAVVNRIRRVLGNESCRREELGRGNRPWRPVASVVRGRPDKCFAAGTEWRIMTESNEDGSAPQAPAPKAAAADSVEVSAVEPVPSGESASVGEQPADAESPGQAVTQDASSSPPGKTNRRLPRRGPKAKGDPPATSEGDQAASSKGKLSGGQSWLLIAGLAFLVLAVVTIPRNESSEVQIERGVAAHQAGRVDQAKRLYEEVLQNEPANAVAHFNLGVVHQEAGESEQAEDRYRRAIEANPNFAQARFNLAILLERTDRPEEAAESYRAILDINPNEAAVHINLGYLLIDRLDRRAEGEDHLRRAVELNPNLVSRIREDLRPALEGGPLPPEPPTDSP